MIVACEQCTTRFKLEESRIPEGGARVRCSRCKHAFVLTPPKQPEKRDLLEELISEIAVQPSAAHSPEEDPDAAAEDFGADAVFGGGDDDSEWEFTESLPTLEGEDDDTRPPAGEARGPAPPPPAVEAAPSPVARDATGPSRVADPAAKHAAEPPGSEAVSAPEASAAARDPLGDLGSPEDWDFLSASPKPAVQEPEAPRLPECGEPSAAAPEPVRSTAPRREPDARGTATELPRRVRVALHAAGWGATSALLLLALHSILLPGPPPIPRAAATLPAGGLVAEEVRGRFVENAFAGPLYVVSGELRNPGSSPAAVGAALRVRLVDEADTRLPDLGAPVGFALDERSLREDPPALLRSRLEASGRALANEPVAPGAGVRFDAILPALPRDARSVALEELLPSAAAPARAGVEAADGATPADPGEEDA